MRHHACYGGRPYRVSLLTGSIEEDRKRTTRGKIYRRETDLVVGTHALIEEKVEFANLGLVVVDEQHRFGVLQRFRLMKKPNAAEPDVLVMTATPIPRTLALSLYGDLDLSVLDELPPGRTPIITRQTSDERAPEVWDFVRKQVAKGHQAYIRLSRSSKVAERRSAWKTRTSPPTAALEEPAPEAAARKPAKKSATKSARAKSLFGESSSDRKPSQPAAMPLSSNPLDRNVRGRLRHTGLAGLRLGLLHGRLSADDKEVARCGRFQRGEIDVLVATTVIEVPGISTMPNATVMWSSSTPSVSDLRPASPAPRQGRTRRGKVLLHSRNRSEEISAGRGAARRDGAHSEWLRTRRARFATARPR